MNVVATIHYSNQLRYVLSYTGYMLFRSHLPYVVIITILFAGMVGACNRFGDVHPTVAHQAEPSTPGTQHLATVSENEVTVSIAFERDAKGNPWLVGTFTPLLEHY